jgi:hypothetical protein
MHMMIPALALGLAMTACAGRNTVYHAGYGRYSGSTAYYAARNGQMPLAVFGNPTQASVPVLAQAVADGLKGSHLSPNVTFTAAETGSAHGYRTVIAFGAATRETICSPEPFGHRTAGTSGAIAAAFCLDDEPLSFASGALRPLSGADDPALRSEMRAIGHALFPPNNPDYTQDCWPGTAKCA